MTQGVKHTNGPVVQTVQSVQSVKKFNIILNVLNDLNVLSSFLLILQVSDEALQPLGRGDAGGVAEIPLRPGDIEVVGLGELSGKKARHARLPAEEQQRMDDLQGRSQALRGAVGDPFVDLRDTEPFEQTVDEIPQHDRLPLADEK